MEGLDWFFPPRMQESDITLQRMLLAPDEDELLEVCITLRSSRLVWNPVELSLFLLVDTRENEWSS